MFSTLSGCAFDVVYGLCVASLPCALHGLWRNDVLSSIRIACSHILCPCLMSSLDVFTCVCFHLLHLLCGFMFLAHLMFTLACRDHTLFCLDSQVMCIVPPYAVVFVCGISWLSY